jgi:N utilization substance protein B
MNDLNLTIKENLRHVSIRKKTASRICSTQVLYSFSFSSENIDLFIDTYLDNYLSIILKQLNLKKIDYELFYTIIKGVCDNLIQIDDIISKNLSKKWSIDRLSKTEKSILRLATYELLFEKKFKKLTIINEYISIIDVFCGDTNFANGILDNISKELK